MLKAMNLLLMFCLGVGTTPIVAGQSDVGAKRDIRSTARLPQSSRKDSAADANEGLGRAVAAARSPRPAVQQKANQYGFRTEFTYATMSDGVKIALAIGYPNGFQPADANGKWPAMLNMMGYEGSTEPESPSRFGHRYVTVRASLRGAGASGGVIRAISRRNGLDGYEIIENWIVKQPWSNGKVALHGHSWGGLTGFMIAATNPPHLKAVAVSGLLDDVYRDIGRIGGIRNSGFPVDWMVQLYSPFGPFNSGRAAIRARGMELREYRRIVASRPPMDFSNSLLWQMLATAERPTEAENASPGTFAEGIRAPIHMMHAYQDEQTGPSGVWLWTYVPNDVPKRLILSNGNHGDVMRFQSDRLRWLNRWTLGESDDNVSFDPRHRVRVHFETPRDGRAVNAPLLSSDFPLPETVWTRYYCAAGESLTTRSPANPAGRDIVGDTYQVDPGAADDQLSGVHYLLSPVEPMAFCGPVSVTLWARCSTIDTDFYVALVDVDSDGVAQWLQRGLLRASHRDLDPKRSMWITQAGQKTLIRPRHAHRNPRPVEPGTPQRVDIEIFPVAHVIRPGHQLGIWISQPPKKDPVTRSRKGAPSYQYASAPPRGAVTILRSARYPSSVLLPVLPKLPPMSDQPPLAGGQAGIYIK